MVDMTTVPNSVARVLYDPGANPSIVGENVDTSLVSRSPEIITLENLASGTTATVQVRVHPNSEWYDVHVEDGSNPRATVTFDKIPNFARVVRTGTQNFKVFAQELKV